MKRIIKKNKLTRFDFRLFKGTFSTRSATWLLFSEWSPLSIGNKSDNITRLSHSRLPTLHTTAATLPRTNVISQGVHVPN